MAGRKIWTAGAVAGMAAALLSASAPAEGTGETERCPAAKSGEQFEDKPKSNIDGVEIDLMNPEIELETRQASTPWSPRVSNDSGADLSEAVLEIAVDQPSGCKLPIGVGDVPDECDASEEEQPGCTAREEAAEDCEYTKASGEESVGSGAGAVCRKDVATGGREFTLSGPRGAHAAHRRR